MPVPVIVVRRGVLVDLNAAALPPLGGGPLKQWIGKSLYAIIEAQAPPEFYPLYGQARPPDSAVTPICRLRGRLRALPALRH